MSVSNKIGPPVEGDDFFGRGKELEQANKLLERGHSLLLSAPRRIGKSSFAKRLIEMERAKGWKCAYIDLEETTTEEGFLRLIVDTFSETGIWKRVTKEISAKLSSLLDRLGKITVGSISFEIAPKEAEENLYQDLKELIRHDEDTLIVIDELSLFLGLLHKSTNGAEKTTYILNWLRSLRQINGTKVRWLFCGSVGLRNFTASLNLGYAINDLTEIGLGEMDREEADYKLSKVLEMLENDGYIIKHESIRAFRSPLLRDYWFGKFVQ